MRYVSTRGQAPVLSFDHVTLTGLAVDGGLYVPESYPVFSAAQWAALATLPYPALAAAILAPFVGNTLTRSELDALCARTYAPFRHAAVAPLLQLAPQHWLMELYHGPTLAFKDYALQLLGQLFDTFLARSGQRLTIVGATSGDTGSAAIEACRDKSTMRLFILHPHGRVSDVQRRQMTSVLSDNVHNLAINGTFDDCQALVKAMFNDAAFRQRHTLSAVNSINWARILGQVVYYAAAALALGAPHRPVSFAIPTGNFGNVFAAWVAKQMGLPIRTLHITTNRNDILARFWQTGTMQTAAVEPSLSPSMDIQVSSNFERLLFEVWNRDGARVAAALETFKATGQLRVSPTEHAVFQQTLRARAVDDTQILAEIRRVYHRSGIVIDPHTATGTTATPEDGVPLVSLACAHGAKFPDAVEKAIGIRPALPSFLADLQQRPERVQVLENDLATVQAYIEQAR